MVPRLRVARKRQLSWLFLRRPTFMQIVVALMTVTQVTVTSGERIQIGFCVAAGR